MGWSGGVHNCDCTAWKLYTFRFLLSILTYLFIFAVRVSCSMATQGGGFVLSVLFHSSDHSVGLSLVIYALNLAFMPPFEESARDGAVFSLPNYLTIFTWICLMTESPPTEQAADLRIDKPTITYVKVSHINCHKTQGDRWMDVIIFEVSNTNKRRLRKGEKKKKKKKPSKWLP
ncbi:hypothetical protein V8F20_008039 [Naviculisporaceae sp. PSN 640]